MKNVIGMLFVVLALGMGYYSYTMPVLETFEQEINVSNSIENIHRKDKKADIVNYDLLSKRTNYLICAGILAIIGTICIVAPTTKK